ncbi:MAG: hypothetical protein WC423_09970 [Vulcanimicrobiota bacterium]
MRLEYSPMSGLRALSLSALFFAALMMPAAGEPDSPIAQGVRKPVISTAKMSPPAQFQKLKKSVDLAREIKAGTGSAQMREVEQAVSTVLGELDNYPNLGRVHGHEEPMWLSDRGDLTSQAILALVALQEVAPSQPRRETLRKLAQGLRYLQRKERYEYPFGAHISWQDEEPFAYLDDGTSAPTTYYRTDRAYAVEALAEAGRVLGEPAFVESAIKEALGMATHLVVHGKLISSFSPQPEYSNDLADALPIVEGFVALYESTGNKLYSDLAALSTRWDQPASGFSGPRWEELKKKIEASPSASLLRAEPVGEPITFQYMEAEEGKVVNKAIDTLDFRSPAGEQGTLAVMGRENTFWMRFDVPTEDDYVFDLSYLQSDVGGGLVSVMMRIDGDKIFQVPLGDVDGKPILRRAFVDGPRPLRAGPHSFGIRFSGLLMTKPALLDSVVVQPAVERREFALPGGERLYLLRNVTGEAGRTDREHFASWPPLDQLVVDGQGQPAKLGHSEDRRRRKEYVTLPPHGVALLWVRPE